jgi:hypothetical protein
MGIFWQITPIALTEAVTGPDPAAAKQHLCSGGDLNPILGFCFPLFSRVLPGEFPSG